MRISACSRAGPKSQQAPKRDRGPWEGSRRSSEGPANSDSFPPTARASARKRSGRERPPWEFPPPASVPSAVRPDRPNRGGLAWLRLDERGDSVEEWGRLLDPSALRPGSGVRGPALGIATDGRLLRAYYEARDGGHWNLRMTPMAFAPDGRPRTVTEPGHVVAEGCLGVIPAAFSRDGRLVNVVTVGRGGSPVVQRIDLDALWKCRSAPGIHNNF